MSNKIFNKAVLMLGDGRELTALMDQALVSGTNFLTNIALARALGLSEYGIFALSWTCVLFANSLQWAFVVQPMMSVSPKQGKNDRPAYFGAVLLQEVAFAGISSFLLFCGVVCAEIYIPQWNLKNLSLPLAFAALSYQMQDFLRRYFFCVRSSKHALVCDAVSYLPQLPIIIVLTHLRRFSVSDALWIIGTTSLVGFAIAFRWMERCRLDGDDFRRVLVRHWKISRWIAPSAFMQWGSGNLFAMAAPIYYGTAAAGILRASQNIVGVAHIWFLGLDNIVPAETARIMHISGAEAASAYVKTVVIRWGLVTAIFVSMVAAFPSFWLKLAYGQKYVAYGHVLQLYAAMYAIVFLAGPLRAALQALEYTAPIFWSYSAMTIFSVFAAGAFARRLGLIGAVLGMIATQVIFQSVVGVLLFLRLRKLRTNVISIQNL